MADEKQDAIGGESGPRRRTGPHAPLPTAETAAAVGNTQAKPVDVRYSEEDSRTRAARRAAELREHLGPSMGDEIDKFYIDPRIVPDGWTYEWRTRTVLGKEDPSYQVDLARKGFEPVPAHRHPELMPDGYRGETIERDGQTLMERPKQISDESRARDLQKARSQVRQKEEQLAGVPAGPNSPFDPTNKGSPLVKIGKSYEAVSVPKD